uniref:Uncharacterized protein n=1 Tax=Solanum lycopersicum TaxID=4081 RepID=A0A3Q7GA99_SOLLC
MTSKSCRNGTERCNEALQKLGNKYDIVVNIQRDEPLIEPETIVAIVKALQAAPNAVFGTVVMSLKPEDALDPNRVKCVVESRVVFLVYCVINLITFVQTSVSLFAAPSNSAIGLKVLENGYKMKVIKVDHETHSVDTPEDVDKIE